MDRKSRGAALTIFALLFGLLAISDFMKPLSHNPQVGFVFMGVRQSGTPNAILGPLFGVGLVIFAYGIWTMRRYALPVAYIFTAWVIVNTVLFAIKNQSVQHQQSILVSVVSVVVGIGVPLATAITLSRRSGDLVG